jgi:hypothetical protein
MAQGLGDKVERKSQKGRKAGRKEKEMEEMKEGKIKENLTSQSTIQTWI